MKTARTIAFAAVGLGTLAMAAGQGAQPGTAEPARPRTAPGAQPEGMPETRRPGMRERQPGMEGAPEVSAQREPLLPLTGVWELEATINRPDGEPIVHRAQAVRRWMLDGAFLQEVHPRAREVGMGGGQQRGGPRLPGIGYYGYDQEEGKYNAVWLDASTGGIYSTFGTYDEATKTFTYTVRDPSSGGLVREGEMVTVTLRIESDDRNVVEMHRGQQGQGELVYRIEYTRAEGPGMMRDMEGIRPRWPEGAPGGDRPGGTPGERPRGEPPR